MGRIRQAIAVGLNSLMREVPTGPIAGPAIGPMVTSKTPVPKRGSKEFLQAYSTMPWLRATTHRIAESTSAVRWHLFAARPVRRGATFRHVNGYASESPKIRQKLLSELRDMGELVEIFDHPLLRALHEGNDALIGSSVRRVTQVYLDILGEAFWLKQRDSRGVIIALWPIPPIWIQRVPTLADPTFVLQLDSLVQHIPFTEILWFKDPDPVNPYGRGSGFAGALADELETDEFAAKYTKTFFYNDAMPTAIITPKGDDNSWSLAQVQQMKTKWMHEHQGFWKSFKMQFSRTPLDVHQLGFKFRDMQLGDLRRAERDIIVQTFGIPPEMIGINENSNRATINAAQLIFATNVLVPRLEHQRETMQLRLVPEYDSRLLLDYDDPTPENDEFNLEVAKAQPQALTQNEWRALSGHVAVEGGDVYYVPTTSTPVASLDEVPVIAEAVSAERSVVRPLESIPSFGPVHELIKLPNFVDDVPDDDLYLLVHRIADKLTPTVQRNFLNAVRVLQQSTDTAVLESALRSRLSAHAVDDIIPWNDLIEAFRETTSATFRQGLIEAGQGTAKELAEQVGNVAVSFNEANPMVTQFASEHAGSLVVQVTDTSRQAIRDAVSTAYTENRNMATVARELRDSIGLLPRQVTTLEKFRGSLVTAGRSDDEIARRVERQARSLLRKRSQVIARTEMIDVASEGQHQLWNQASGQGQLDTDRARRFWITTPDDRLDITICEPIPFMNRSGVKLNDPFETPAGPKMRPTAHPMCRCAVTLRFPT